jgi:GT2 family glycosyltransferase
MPRFSVIVPVYRRGELLSRCLESIRASSFEDYEIVVSDDGSPEEEDIRSIAMRHGARLISASSRRGSAAARNCGAEAASGDTLVFVDADVSVHPETLQLIADAFDRDPTVSAVMGSYDCQPSAQSWISQFRNLLHAYTHQHSRREAATFWTGCGAIRRECFLQLGGFKDQSIEDVELGLRLKRAGGRILLAPEIQVTHHKTWTLVSMVETDIFARAIPWVALWREYGLPRDLNFQSRDRLGVALTALIGPLAWVAFRHGPAWWGILASTLIAIAAAQAPLLRFLSSAHGTLFAIGCFPLVLVYNLTCIAGLLAGLFRVEHRRDPHLAMSLLACGCLILGLQIAGGAYHAEFNGHPDEPAHFVSGLMIYDYLTSWPSENPVHYAIEYYLHYPKVAIGHWPPGFYVVEAFWWLLFLPSRSSSMLLNATLALLAAAVVYRLIRSFAPLWLALGAALLLIATPVVQESLDLSMSDMLCLVWAALLMDATARLVRQPSPRSMSLVALWLICALLTKGTAACLAPAPLVALLVAGKRRMSLRWALGTGGAVILLGFGWYAIEEIVLRHDVRMWGGVTTIVPWQIFLLPSMAGYGFLVLAGLAAAPAIRRGNPVGIAATATAISIVAVSFFLRAMNEPRHWIIVFPALLILSVEFVTWLQTQTRAWIVAVVPALLLFPFGLYRQRPLGLLDLVNQVHRPTRMLVSSTPPGEGAWIAEVALAEKRPSSVVVRATKALASSGWNGEHYRLIAKSPDEVETRLDELGIDEVILLREPGVNNVPHHVLLQQAMVDSDSWQMLAVSSDVTLYRRTKPARASRVPLRIDLRSEIGRVAEE